MINTLALINLEEKILASYAVKSRDSKGRCFAEKISDVRTDFQRDRDRVIHSRSFRRLKHKTQVFVSSEGDHFRTRLTHTIEVAQIARHIARLLSLNEDLAETIALAHDLGHTPFGHAGEKVMDELTKDIGGFEHNKQSLRIVTKLEKKYPDFNGLNLTYEVIQGLKKHETPWDNCNQDPDCQVPSLEAQAVNLADEVAYNNHDLDDGYEAKILSLDMLRQNQLWQEAEKIIKEKYQNISEKELKNLVISYLIGWQIRDICLNAEQNIKKENIISLSDIKSKIISYSFEMSEMNNQMRGFLLKNFYQHPKVLAMNNNASKIIKKLFDYYLKNHKIVEDSLKHIFKAENLKRHVADYISGMTDNFAQNQYQNIK